MRLKPGDRPHVSLTPSPSIFSLDVSAVGFQGWSCEGEILLAGFSFSSVQSGLSDKSRAASNQRQTPFLSRVQQEALPRLCNASSHTDYWSFCCFKAGSTAKVIIWRIASSVIIIGGCQPKPEGILLILSSSGLSSGAERRGSSGARGQAAEQPILQHPECRASHRKTRPFSVCW